MSRLGDNGSTFPRVPVAAIQCYLLVASFGVPEHSDAATFVNSQLLAWVGQDAIFVPLRSEPRFIALMRKLNFVQ